MDKQNYKELLADEISKVFSEFKWTPPIQKEEKNLIPILEAILIVEPTVVAPFNLLFTAIDKLFLVTLYTFLFFAKICISFSFNPTFIFPLMIAIVAGMDPFFLTALIDDLAIFIFSG